MDSALSTHVQVGRLVEMYGEYKALLTRQADCRRQLAKAKLRREDTVQLRAVYDDLTTRLQQISDTMTFASPSVWILYKYEAYADEPQAIRTMQDFRQHCSKPDYICTKRFDFLNTSLVRRGAQPLTDTVQYPDEMSLADVVPAISDVESDDIFMRAWHSHEYYRDSGRVAKWENA